MILALFAALLAFVCVRMLFIMSRYEYAMCKLEAQRRAEYYARKRELAGLPPYDQKASTKAHEETEREAFRRNCATHIFRVKI
jgi:hypothetical protein